MSTPVLRPVTFRVVAVSDISNSFGLFGHVLMARDGRTFEAGRHQGAWLKELNPGDEIVLMETLLDEHGVTPADVSAFDWAAGSFEIPRSLPKPPASVLKEVWP